LSGQDLRAAAEAHQELGHEYGDAVIDSFLEKLEARLDERMNARLAEAKPRRQLSLRRVNTDGRSKTAQAAIALGAGGVGASLSLLAAYTDLWSSGPTATFWLLAVLLIACAASVGAGLARTVSGGGRESNPPTTQRAVRRF
jgi:hypothetical protein